MHIFLEKTLSNVKIENVQNLVTFVIHLLCKRVFLWLGHVLKDTNAPRVESFCVGPLAFLTKLFTSASDTIKEGIFLFPACFCFALWVATNVCNGDFDVNIWTNTSPDLLFFFIRSLVRLIASVEHVVMGSRSQAKKCDFSFAHLLDR
jgi:hypothetical protein